MRGAVVRVEARAREDPGSFGERRLRPCAAAAQRWAGRKPSCSLIRNKRWLLFLVDDDSRVTGDV